MQSWWRQEFADIEGEREETSMRRFTGLAVAALVSLIATGILSADTDRLSWAYLIPPPGLTAVPDDGTIHHLTGSDGGFTLTQIRNSFGSTDWYPGDHPPMPSVVSNGRKPDVQACAFLAPSPVK